MLIRWQSGYDALAKIEGMQAGDPIRIEQTRSIYRNSAPGRHHDAVGCASPIV
jgi:hypothetical protein